MAQAEVFRLIERHETNAVATLWHIGWRVGHLEIVPKDLIGFRDEASFRDRILESMSDCFLLIDEGQILGFVRLKGNELDQFYVAPDKIGQGVAKKLMSAAENKLRERGVSKASLFATVGNDRAIRFYEKHGWTNAGQETVGVETAAGPFEMDEVKFEKNLS